MDTSCDFCSEVICGLPQLGSSKVLFSIILMRFHDAGHTDGENLQVRSLNLIAEASSLRLEVVQTKQLLLAKEVALLDRCVALCSLLTDLGLVSFSGSLDSSSGLDSGSDSGSDEGLVEHH